MVSWSVAFSGGEREARKVVKCFRVSHFHSQYILIGTEYALNGVIEFTLSVGLMHTKYEHRASLELNLKYDNNWPLGRRGRRPNGL